jgi:hypothetical protein
VAIPYSLSGQPIIPVFRHNDLQGVVPKHWSGITTTRCVITQKSSSDIKTFSEKDMPVKYGNMQGSLLVFEY